MSFGAAGDLTALNITNALLGVGVCGICLFVLGAGIREIWRTRARHPRKMEAPRLEIVPGRRVAGR